VILDRDYVGRFGVIVASVPVSLHYPDAVIAFGHMAEIGGKLRFDRRSIATCISVDFADVSIVS